MYKHALEHLEAARPEKVGWGGCFYNNSPNQKFRMNEIFRVGFEILSPKIHLKHFYGKRLTIIDLFEGL